MCEEFGRFQEAYFRATPTQEDCKLAAGICEISSEVGHSCLGFCLADLAMRVTFKHNICCPGANGQYRVDGALQICLDEATELQPLIHELLCGAFPYTFIDAMAAHSRPDERIQHHDADIGGLVLKSDS